LSGVFLGADLADAAAEPFCAGLPVMPREAVETERPGEDFPAGLFLTELGFAGLAMRVDAILED